MINLGVDQGLPSGECHDLLRDQHGFIWTATDRGVSRYDGFRFQNYTSIDGLTDNTVFQMQEDSLGRIWFFTYNLEISYFYNGKIFPYEHNERIKEALIKHNLRPERAANFYVSNKSELYITFTSFPGFKIGLDGKLTVLPSVEGSSVLMYKLREKNLFCQASSTFNINRVTVYKQGVIEASSKDTLKQQNSSSAKIFTPGSGCKTGYFAHRKTLYRYTPHTKSLIQPIHTFNNRIISLVCDGADVFIGVQRFGLHKFNGDSLTYLGYAPYSITDMLIEKHNIRMISTLENGLFQFPKPAIKIYTRDEHISHLEMHNGNLYLGGLGPTLYRLDASDDNSNLSPLTIKSNLRGERTIGMYDDPDSNVLWVGRSKSKVSQFSNDTFYKLKHSITPCLAFFRLHKDTLIGSGYQAVNYILKDSTITETLLPLYLRNLAAFHRLPSGELYAGGRYGVVRYTGGRNWKSLESDWPMLGLRATALTSIENNLLIGTRGNGILTFNGTHVARFGMNDGFPSNTINDLTVDAKNQVWVASNQGIFGLEYTKDGLVPFTFIFKEDGLPSNQVLDIHISKNTLYFGTNAGAGSIDLKKISKKPVSKPIILAAKSQDKLLSTSAMDLSINGQDLIIDFISVNSPLKDLTQYRWILEGKSEHWHYTYFPLVHLTDLASGSYKFMVQAYNPTGNQWTESSSIQFRVREKGVSIFALGGIIISLFAIIALFFFRTRFRQKQQRNKLEVRLSQLKHQALTTQLNPHFVFNALNAIQTFLLSNDKRNASKYLNKFAWLMRMTFEHSKVPYIALEQELEMLRLYAELEQLRRNKSFELILKVDEGLDTDAVTIPPMLLQPFVENAIHHGLSSFDKGGKVWVILSRNERALHVLIEDNGIGRKAAQEANEQFQGDRKSSSGVSLSSERLELIQNSKQYYEVKTTDLFNLVGEPTGTRVSFEIPIIAHEA